MNSTTNFLAMVIVLWKARAENMAKGHEDFLKTKRKDCIIAISFISQSFMDEWMSEGEAESLVDKYWPVYRT